MNQSDNAWSKPPSTEVPMNTTMPSSSNWGYSTADHQAFDMRGVERIVAVAGSRNSSLGDISSSREGSLTGASIHPISSDSSPDTTTPPASIRDFDPDKFFGDMNLSASGIDVVMNMGQDDASVEFFTEMLAGNLNGN